MELSGLKRRREERKKQKLPETVDQLDQSRLSQGLSINLRGFALSTTLLAALSGSIAGSAEAGGKYPIKGGAAKAADPQPPGAFDAYQYAAQLNALQAGFNVHGTRDVNEVIGLIQDQCTDALTERSIGYRRVKGKLTLDIGATANKSTGIALWWGEGNVPGYQGPVPISQPLNAQCTSMVNLQRSVAIYEGKGTKVPTSISGLRKKAKSSSLSAFPQVSDASITVVHNDSAFYTNVPKPSKKSSLWVAVKEVSLPRYNVPNHPGTVKKQTFLYRLSQKNSTAFKTIDNPTTAFYSTKSLRK